MIMTNFLKSRRSVRDFRNKLVDETIIEKILNNLTELENEEGSGNIKFKLFENGEFIFKGLEGIGGYSGVMIQSPHYIGLETMNKEEHTIIYGAYYMEKLITNLNKMGLDTCWVSLEELSEEDKRGVFGDYKGEIDYILAFGYAKRRNPFSQEPFSERIGVEELVFNERIPVLGDIDDLESRGLMDLFYYVRFAPSTKNAQPWRFLLKENTVELLLAYPEGEEPLIVDAGIIMYYFEALANMQGIKSKWRFIDGMHKEDTFNYKVVAEFKL